MKEKITSKLKSTFSYYTHPIRSWQLEDKIIITLPFFKTFNYKEKECLKRAQEIFGQQADFEDGYKQKASFIVPLKKVTFLGNTGAVVKNYKIVVESILDIHRMASSKSYRKLNFLKSRKKDGVFTSVLHLDYSNNFYHWNIDCLPRFYNISKIPSEKDINIILHKDQPDYQKEVLSFFLEKDSRLKPVYITSKEKWQIKEFWLPSFLTSGQCGFMPKGHIEYVRNTVLEGYKIQPSTKNKAIYISRRLAKKRKLINEAAIEEYLSSLGIAIIQMESLNFKEQVQVVNDAKLIISPHGAGLSNIIYATNTKIIEIHPSNYVQTHYCMLSSACEHEYTCFIGEKMDDNNNYKIDIENFRLFIEKIISIA